MNLFAHFQHVVRNALEALSHAGKLPAGLDISRVTVEPPRDAAHGDLATNAAMVLAKSAGQPPRAIAHLIAERLAADPDIQSADIAGPGFINIRLKATFWPKLLASASALGADYGRSQMGAGEKVNVEYVSANPT